MPILQCNMGKKQEITQFTQNPQFFNSGDKIKIRVSVNSSLLSFTHVNDFGEYFPDVDLSPPERLIN